MVEHGAGGEAAVKRRGELPWGMIVKVLVALGVLAGLYLLGADATKYLAKQMALYKTDEMLWTSALIYTVLLAIPGIPGVEIGLLMIVMFGAKGAMVVYACTVLALNISFAAGRWMPAVPWVKRWTTALGQVDGQGLGGGVEGAASPEDTRLKEALQRSRVGRWVSRWMSHGGGVGRYVLVGLLLNMPGNFVLGGGGGIGLLCGLNRAFAWWGFMVVVMISVAPLPLLVYFGFLQMDFIQSLLAE